VVYIVADSVHTEECNSVRLIIGKFIDVNGWIQYSFRVFRGKILADSRHSFLKSQGYSRVHSKAIMS